MLRLLADENIRGSVIRGLLLRHPEPDLIVRVQDAGLRSADDEIILAFAAEQERIVVTHDRATMPEHAEERLTDGKAMPGVLVVSNRLSTGQTIDELLLIVECSEAEEWRGRIEYLPL